MGSSASNASQLEAIIMLLGPGEMTPTTHQMLSSLVTRWRLDAFEDLIALEDELEEE